MILAIILVLGLLLRLINLNQSLWLDEAATFVISRSNWPEFISHLKGDFHPPLYYLMVKLFLPLTGQNETLLRIPGVIIGVSTIYLTYLLTIRIVKDKHHLTALIAALFVAINPLHIYYSQELRMYIFNTFFSVLAWIILLDLVSKKTRNWTWFVTISALNLLTFYGSIFNLISQIFFVLIYHRDELRKLIKFSFISFIPILFWSPILFSQLATGKSLQLSLPGWGLLSGATSFKSIGLIFAKFAIGRTTLAHKDLYLVFVAGVMLYFLLSTFIAWYLKEARLIVIYFYIPLVLGIILSFFTPVLGYWRFLFLVPAFSIILAEGVTYLDGRSLHLNMFAISIVFLFSIWAYYQNPFFQREQWRAAAATISKPDSLSILNFPGVFAPLQVYAPHAQYYLTQTSLGKPREDLDSTLLSSISGKYSIFYFDYLSDLTDKGRTAQIWLERAGFVKNKTYNFPGVGFVYEYSAQ